MFFVTVVGSYPSSGNSQGGKQKPIVRLQSQLLLVISALIVSSAKEIKRLENVTWGFNGN